LRFTFDNQTGITSAIQNFGRLIDLSKTQTSTTQVVPLQQQQQQPRYPSPPNAPPQSANHYVSTVPRTMYNQHCKFKSIKQTK